jgi:hypothetical protein
VLGVFNSAANAQSFADSYTDVRGRRLHTIFDDIRVERFEINQPSEFAASRMT